MKANNLIPVTEAERCRSFLDDISDDHPLMQVFINNNPSIRMHANGIVECMSRTVQQFPRDHLDLIEHIINKAKESMQLRPWGAENNGKNDEAESDHGKASMLGGVQTLQQ